MSIKKSLLLASMALAAVAFAVPAAASAAPATVTDNGSKITTSQELHFVGTNVKFEAVGSGIECEVTTKVTVKEDINEVTNFTINTPTCVFFGNPYKNCKFEPTEGDTVTRLPWVVDPEINAASEDLLTLTGNTAGEEAQIDGKLEAKTPPTACFTTQNDLLLKHDPANGFGVTLTIITKNGFIDGAKIGGNIKVVNSLGTGTAGARGEFLITPTETSTYTMSLTP